MDKVTGAGVLFANMSSASRIAVASVAFICVAWWPCEALADDPCEASGAEVKRLLADLNNATAANRKPGIFRVEQERSTKGAQRLRTTFLIDGKPIYTGAIEQQSNVSDEVAIRVSRSAPTTLEIHYASGGGGAISCNYRISRSSDHFIASKSK